MKIQYRAQRPTAFSADDSDMLTVETLDNHIYFYADVTTDRALALIQEVRRLDANLRNEQTSRGIDETHPKTPIWLHIHSYGGDLFTGFSLADQLKMIQSPIYTIVEGICASAATLIAMVGSHRYILPSAFMLVHQLSAGMWGTHEQFKDQFAMQQKTMERLVAFYEGHSKLSADQIREMLKRDTWLDAEECIQNGFALEVMR